MYRRLALWSALSLALLPAPLAAHPHIFVDTGLRLEVDAAGLLRAVEVTWTYDDFYSLLVFEDRQLNTDLDGALTAAELAQLQGFDLNWVEGFEGDLYLSQGETPVRLGPPEPLATEVAQGIITTRHRRVLTEPLPAASVTLRAYDPTYYTAYQLTRGVEVSGVTCAASIAAPDLDRAYTLVEELLYAMPAEAAETAYPEVGRSFAATVSLSCGG